MNKSEIELENVQRLVNEMPSGEREICARMIDSLNASLGHPVHGRIFMMAVAYVNCLMAVTTIRLGLINPDGSAPENYPGTRKEENKAIDKVTYIASRQKPDSKGKSVGNADKGSNEMMDGYNRLRDAAKAMTEDVPRETKDKKTDVDQSHKDCDIDN